MRFLFPGIALIFLGLTTPATAQSWFTREACEVTEPKINPSVVGPDLLAQLDAEAGRIENANGRLWQVTSASGAVSHLWGTYHSNHREVLDLPQQLRDALATAEVVGNEIDPTAMTREQMTTYASGDGFYELVPRPMFTLDDRVRVWIDERLSSLGYQQGILDQLTPAAALSMLLSDPCEDFTAGTFPIQDSLILLLGRQAGAEIVGLETWEDISAHLNDPENFHLTEALIDVYGSLLSPVMINQTRSTIFAFYLKGQIGHMMALGRIQDEVFFGAGRAAEIRDALDGYLVEERNLSFVKNVAPHFENGGAVIAVGAFHLPGPNGMIELLRGAGFLVERIPVAGEIP